MFNQLFNFYRICELSSAVGNYDTNCKMQHKKQLFWGIFHYLWYISLFFLSLDRDCSYQDRNQNITDKKDQNVQTSGWQHKIVLCSVTWLYRDYLITLLINKNHHCLHLAEIGMVVSSVLLEESECPHFC